MSKIPRSLVFSFAFVTLLVAGCSNPDLSQENLTQLKLGMTLKEVEKIIGSKAKVASESVKRKVADRAARFGQASPSQDKPGATKYVFSKKNTWLFVDINDETNKVVGFHRWASSSGRNMKKF